MKIKGLISAPFAPMHEDGTLNIDQIPAYADFLRRNGNAGVFVNGSTGEGLSLTVQERIQLAEAWINHQNNDFKIMIHVGHNCLEDAKVLANHAEQIKADAFGAFAPSYYKPDLHNLIDFCAELADSASSLPFYYYHIPAMTGVNVNMLSFLKEAGDKIANLAGVKYTHEDLMDYMLCLQLDDRRYDMLFGRDEILLSGLATGAQGAVGSSYNCAAPLYNHIIKCFQTGNLDEARQYQLKSTQLIQLYRKYGVASPKAIMKLTGLDCGSYRKPLALFTEKQYQQLQNDLESISFFDFCSK